MLQCQDRIVSSSCQQGEAKVCASNCQHCYQKVNVNVEVYSLKSLSSEDLTIKRYHISTNNSFKNIFTLAHKFYDWPLLELFDRNEIRRELFEYRL